jgi:hypothetical protein
MISASPFGTFSAGVPLVDDGLRPHFQSSHVAIFMFVFFRFLEGNENKWI